MELESGDMVCVCSDGVVEAGLESGREFGEERLISLMAAHRDWEIGLAVARIVDDARLWEPNGPGDDMTVAGLQCRAKEILCPKR